MLRSSLIKKEVITMNKIDSKNLYTDRLELRIPTMKEQHRIWEF